VVVRRELGARRAEEMLFTGLVDPRGRTVTRNDARGQ
jgi:hypothetical protein